MNEEVEGGESKIRLQYLSLSVSIDVLSHHLCFRIVGGGREKRISGTAFLKKLRDLFDFHCLRGALFVKSKSYFNGLWIVYYFVSIQISCSLRMWSS